MEEIVYKIKEHYEKGILCAINNDDEVIYIQNKYPKLFKMITSPNCDDIMLNKMLKLLKNIQDGNTTQEDADVQFGTVAVEKYVAPLTKNKRQRKN
tara:strand:- start:1339 stop:1626 length:288 start_codon:yes stop_codon:yes gene_type:complete